MPVSHGIMPGIGMISGHTTPKSDKAGGTIHTNLDLKGHISLTDQTQHWKWESGV